jgi:hypothetical protein
MAFENDVQLPPGLTREERFILHNYYRLLGREEKLRHRWFLAQRRGDAPRATMYARLLDTPDPAAGRTEVEHLSAAAQALRAAQPERVLVPKCASCGEIPRTPRARICPGCGEEFRIWSGAAPGPVRA